MAYRLPATTGALPVLAGGEKRICVHADPNSPLVVRVVARQVSSERCGRRAVDRDALTLRPRRSPREGVEDGKFIRHVLP